MDSHPSQQIEVTEAEMWTSPADHFRPRAKMLTLYTDRDYMVMRWLKLKESVLSKAWLPWWTPMYMAGTHFGQRSRNMFLCENHLNYRPYKFRPNTESSKF